MTYIKGESQYPLSLRIQFTDNVRPQFQTMVLCKPRCVNEWLYVGLDNLFRKHKITNLFKKDQNWYTKLTILARKIYHPSHNYFVISPNSS